MSPQPSKIYDSAPTEDTSWLLTYGDTITLLMIFFVLLFSTSKVSEEKFDKVAQSINESLNRPAPDPITNQQTVLPPLLQAKIFLEEIIKDKRLEQQMKLDLTRSGLKIELSSNSFFASGSAEVRENMVQSLKALSGVIQNLPVGDYRVEIEGHTDNVPIKTAKFPSNWELSALRAINVLHIFEETGLTKHRLSATAFATTKPKAANTDSRGQNIAKNQAMNRRVVVFIKNVEDY